MKGRSYDFSPFDMQLIIDDGDLMQDDAQMIWVEKYWWWLHLESSHLLLEQNSSKYSEKSFFRCLLVRNLTLMLGFTIIVLQARWSIGALTNKESNKLLWKIPCFVAALGNPSVARQGHECHHQGPVPPGGEDLPDHTQPGGARHPPRHRSSLGQRGFGYLAAVLWVYGQQYQGKTHDFGIHRADCRQTPAAVEIFRSGELLIHLVGANCVRPQTFTPCR